MDSNEKCDKAVEVIAWIRAKAKSLEMRRKFFVEPLNAHIKTINGFFKEFSVPMETAEGLVFKKVQDWRQKERERIEKEQKQKEMEAKKLAKKIDLPVDLVPVEQVAKQETKTDSGSFYLEDDFEVIDKTKLPYDYLEPNLVLIRKAMKEGKQIPGVKYFKVERFRRG